MFGFCCADDDTILEHGNHPRAYSHAGQRVGGGEGGGIGRHASFPAGGAPPSADRKKEVEVFVREKVRVETADPSLLSLSSKLTALGLTLGVARRNLAAVMGEELED